MKFSDLRTGDWFHFKNQNEIYIKINEAELPSICELNTGYIKPYSQFKHAEEEVEIVFQYEYYTSINHKILAPFSNVDKGALYYPFGFKGDYSCIAIRTARFKDVIIWQNNDFIPSQVGNFWMQENDEAVVLVPTQIFQIQEKEFI